MECYLCSSEAAFCVSKIMMLGKLSLFICLTQLNCFDEELTLLAFVSNSHFSFYLM